MTWRVEHGDCIEAMRAMDDCSVDSVVCDPPYGLSAQPDIAEVLRHWLAGDDYKHRGSGFMGKTWDSFVPGPAVWREASRVLKPGGHLLAFFGTRTYDLGVIAIRLAGFEVRDQVAWMFGSGFPKSLDVSKAIDGYDAPIAQIASAHEFTAWMRSTGVTAAQINQATDSFMGGHYTTAKSQPQIPTAEHWALIRPLVPDVPEWVDAMIGTRAVSENLQRREVVGEREMGELVYSPGASVDAERRVVEETLPHTPEAAAWEGWGTALKPGYEPIVLARKPLAGTVARNVLAHGTGALNVDGCRVGDEGGTYSVPTGDGIKSNQVFGVYGHAVSATLDAGRWPANVVLDSEAAAMLDKQTGELHSQDPATRASASPVQGVTAFSTGAAVAYGDSGGASRFFYCAKTSSAERNAGLDGFEAGRTMTELPDADWATSQNPYPMGGANDDRRNIHPTVKPIDLMRWLCRLVTPPGGTVLDPFAGSGTTGCAAVLEGFDFIGCEMGDDYIKLARARIAWWARAPVGIGTEAAIKAIGMQDINRRVGQGGLFDEEAA